MFILYNVTMSKVKTTQQSKEKAYWVKIALMALTLYVMVLHKV